MGRRARRLTEGAKRRLTERVKECGDGYIHHPPTRSPYPLIRSVRSLCRSARHAPCTGSRACIAPCSRLALLRQNRSIWSFVRYYLPSSPLASVRYNARLASREPKYPGASCATTCPPRLWLRCAPLCVRHYYAFVVRPSQADCVLQSCLRARVYL